MSEARTIHLEGTDCSGKSSIAKLFPGYTGMQWEVRRGSILASGENATLIIAKSLAENKAIPAEIIGDLFVAAVQEDIARYTSPVNNVLQDSLTILRSAAFHSVSGVPRIGELMIDLLPSFPRFTNSFYLTVDLESRRSRLDKRLSTGSQAMTTTDNLMVSDPERFQNIDRKLQDLAVVHFKADIIDTSHMMPNEIAADIARITGILDSAVVE